MEAWYPSPVPHFQLEMSSASASPTIPTRARKVSLPVARADYDVSGTISPPSSERSSHSPPPLGVTRPVETDFHYSHDPEVYAYLPHEQTGVPVGASSGEQLQYHQWEINQLMGSSHTNSRYMSDYFSTLSRAVAEERGSYPVAYDASHLDNDSISGYASSSSPPSTRVRRPNPPMQNHQDHFEEPYDVIHHAFKPMSSDLQASNRHPSGPSGHHAKNLQQPHYSDYLSISHFESMGPVRTRLSPKKTTKENVKRFPCT